MPNIAFPVLMLMVLGWFIMVKLLFNRLESAHSDVYESMGRPTLFWRNSTAGAFAMLKFLVLRQHKSLNDSYLSKLSDFMLVFLVVYLVLFFSLFFGVISQPRPHAA